MSRCSSELDTIEDIDYLGKCELGLFVVDGDSVVAGQSQFQASAEARTHDGRHNGLLRVLDPSKLRLAFPESDIRLLIILPVGNPDVTLNIKRRLTIRSSLCKVETGQNRNVSLKR